MPTQTSFLVPFSPDEASTKVGKRVRVIRELPPLPAGTTGTVIGVCSNHKGLVVVHWDLPIASDRTWENWFGKTKYEAYLTEIEQI